MQQLEIIRPPVQRDKDAQVPDFGGYKPEQLRHPEKRPERSAVVGNEALAKLHHNALERALFFSYRVGERPPVPFPNAEHFQHFPFTHEHWEAAETNGMDLESEACRLEFMLQHYESRRFPAQLAPICEKILESSDNILQAWGNAQPQIELTANAIYQNTVAAMDRAKEHEPLQYVNHEQGAFQSKPIAYEVSAESGEAEMVVWQRAIGQASRELNQGNDEHVTNFLNLYNRIKDPITPVRAVEQRQAEIFQQLYAQAREALQGREIDIVSEQKLIIQLALESSFLALPAADEIVAVAFGDHHELAYIGVELTQLPRGEFANPQRVVQIMEEILQESAQHQQAVVTPITVGYFQEPQESEAQLFIVDGNNRSTALLLMQYLSEVGYDIDSAMQDESIRAFVKKHNLDIEWERDVVLALQELMSSEKLPLIFDQSNQEMMNQCAGAKIPALLVQEANFHTIAVERSEESGSIHLLQPMHQAIYNQRRAPMAIPSKQQTHGRTEGNDIRIPVLAYSNYE